MHVSRNLSFTAWAYVKFVSTADAASTFVKKRLNEDGYLPLATEIKGITHIAAGVIYLSGVLYLECMTPDKQTEYTIHEELCAIHGMTRLHRRWSSRSEVQLEGEYELARARLHLEKGTQQLLPSMLIISCLNYWYARA